MKVFLDTNVILDLLLDHTPFAEDAALIMDMGLSGKIACAFSTNAAADIFYIFGKTRGNIAAKLALAHLLGNLEVVSVEKTDCIHALTLTNDDFEDALAEACAKKAGADFIVSCDDEFASVATEVKAITPSELISKITR